MTKNSLKLTLLLWFILFTLLPMLSVAYIYREQELVSEIILLGLFFSSFLAYYLAQRLLSPPLETKKNSLPFHSIEWDQDDLLHRLGNSQSNILSTIKLFLQDASKHLQLLDIAIQKTDFSQIAVLAHTLKGTTANMSLLNVTQIAKEIEKDAKHTKDIQHIIQLYAILKEKCQNANMLLENFVEENQIEKRIILSNEDIQNSLSVLETMIHASEFIQTSEVELFDADISTTINIMLKKLQKEIDGFLFDKALVSISDIQIALKKES